MTVTPATAWPPGNEQPKVLLHLLVQCSVDALWEDFFGSYPEVQAKLHKQRNDSNCAESPWVSQRADLPAQQFLWPAPPAGADPGTPGQGKCRKVRFEAAASLASKAFSSEEVQTVLSYAPGSHYLVQAEVSTSAMYGDTFTIISRTALLQRGPGQAVVHVAYAVDFRPSLSRLMKPMVAKGVDGGIRGTFGMLKKLLQEQYSLKDLPEAAPAPTLPGAAAAAAAPAAAAAAAASAAPAAAAPIPAPTAAAAAAGAAVGMPALLQLADYLVYQELVAGLLHVSDPAKVAKGLAMCLTLGLIHLIITLLRPLTRGCAAVTAAGGGGLSGLLCWPLVGVLRVPDSVAEVLSALLLVAAANRLLVVGMQLAAAWLSAQTAAAPAHQLLAASDEANSSAAAMANGIAPADAAAAGEASGITPTAAAAAAPAAPATSAPVDIPGRSGAASPAAAAAAVGNGTPGSGEGLMQNLGSVMTGWGRNLLGANVVDSFSSNEGFKLFMSGGWQRGSSGAALPADQQPQRTSSGQGSGQGAGSGAADAALPAVPDGSSSSSSSTAAAAPARAMSHRKTNSFTATMDPSGLNIIEDYAQSPELLPMLAEERPASPAAAAAAAGLAGTSPRPGSSRSMASSYEAAATYVIPGEEDEDEVLVEVFEHERVQPFRGWGHTWPGHFLPSDKVGHWGDRAGAPGGAMSMLFDRVAPKLPPGWGWRDAEWSVDMTGVEAEGCDADGWAYAMDFQWLAWPPEPQNGRAGIKSFVRRRRWVRTRVRLPPGSYDAAGEEQQQQAAAFRQQQAELAAAAGRGSAGSSATADAGLIAGLGLGR
ncbi:hypothetical protein OEZ86_011477 [Tetradesmus obliquus]|nr:hypothetical protein OEZ86_011477 [Tetradesmus obliquus]